MSNQSTIDKLRVAGFRATTHRVYVLDYFHKNHKPVSVKTLIKDMGKKDIDQATIYRMLIAYKEASLIKQIDFQDGETYYESYHEHDDHHHIICTVCKKVEDFHNCGFENLEKRVLKESKHFKFITHHTTELFGVCKSCSKI